MRHPSGLRGGTGKRPNAHCRTGSSNQIADCKLRCTGQLAGRTSAALGPCRDPLSNERGDGCGIAAKEIDDKTTRRIAPPQRMGTKERGVEDRHCSKRSINSWYAA